MDGRTPLIPEQYPPRVRIALQHLDAAGVKRSMSAPLLYRLFWRMGLAVAPPVLSGFLANLVSSSVWFGVGWGGLMWLLIGRNSGMPALAMGAAALLAGVLFGLCMALLLFFQRQRFGLPLWRDIDSLPRR